MVQNFYPRSSWRLLSWFSGFVRLAVFKDGIYQEGSWLQRFLLERWRNHFAGSGYCSRRRNFDPIRAESMCKSLEKLGGEREQLTTQDGAVIDSMLVKASSLREKIKTLGGDWKKDSTGTQIVIVPPETPSQGWNDLYKELQRLFGKEKEFDKKLSLVTASNANTEYFNQDGDPKCVLLARLGQKYVMDKTNIAYFLGMGLDVALYDPRGAPKTFEDGGKTSTVEHPSELGVYLDIEAAKNRLEKAGYKNSQITAFASCGESFSASYLYCKNPGINLFMCNQPASLDRAIFRIHTIARKVFQWLSGALYKNGVSRDGNEDGFNSLQKMKDLPMGSQYGKVTLIFTTNDPMAPHQDFMDMERELSQKASKVEILENDPKHNPGRGGDVHLSDPLKNSNLQEAIQKALFV